MRTDRNWQSMAHAANRYRRFDGLNEGRWYDFRVQSTSVQGRSEWVEARRMVPNPSSNFPAYVEGFGAALQNGKVKLSFDRYRDLTVVRLQVKRTHTGSNGVAETTTFYMWNQPDMESHVDMGATAPGRYDYRMRAVNAYMERSDSRMAWDTWSPLATVTK